jgi:hypothetical protein
MVPNPTPIYHITHMENLEGIIAKGRLIAQSAQAWHGVDYCNIAHSTIQDRRSQTPVPCGPGGNLHDYIPFYFAPRSPMLYAIHKGSVDGCTAGQNDIVYLVSSAQRVHRSDNRYVFTDGHGIMALSDFYDDLQDLAQVDWQVMKDNYWADTDDDPDRKRRRQAEFLVHHNFDWNLVEEIAVLSQIEKNRVGTILNAATHKPPIIIRQDWYY